MTVSITKELKNKLEKFSNLPSIPQVVLKIKQISEDPKSSVADLANAILSDHQLTSRILRMANSAYYSEYAGKVNTITHAIVLMGFRAVRNIAISMSIYGMINKLSRDSKFDITSFWTRSVACGVMSKFLAERINKLELIEVAFIAGFMHDIGQIILANVFPDEYGQIVGSDSFDVWKIEQQLMDMDHMEAGSFVAQKWNLPDGLVEIITDHHRIDKTPDQLSDYIMVDIVYLSDRAYNHLISGSSPSSKAYSVIVKEAYNLIGVSEQDMMELLDVCREQMTEIAQDLQIDIDQEFDRYVDIEKDSLNIQTQLTNKEVHLALLQNFTHALIETKSDDEILQVVCETIYRGLQLGRVSIFELDVNTHEFRGRVGFGFETQQEIQSLRFSSQKGLLKYIMETGKALSVVDSDNEIYGKLVSVGESKTMGTKAFAIAPIKIIDGVKYIILADATVREIPIDYDSLQSITALANQAVLSLERSLFKKKLGL